MRDGIEAMMEFYRTERADDCSLDDDGDMLLFQWGTRNATEDPQFELDITRQFIPKGAEDDDMLQLSLTFVFPPNKIASGNRWCAAPDELDEFAKLVRSSAAYLAAMQLTPIDVELDFECVG